MSLVTTIDLIRHGEPVGGRRYRGQIDDPLSDKGWQQMRNAVADHHPWDQIISSSLSRCSEFAEEVAQRHDLPLQLDERLMEIGFGSWEGRTAEELMENDAETLKNFWSDPVNYRPEGAEALTDFRDRIIAGWNDVLTQHAGKHLLIVGHAGMMRMIIRHVLDMPLERMFRLSVPNAGITRIRIDGEGDTALPQLVFHAGQL
ncbi:MAG: alpha-ribazole phosphatase [Gammaproteobacteria bacterium]|nr:alpha-ribazole phosphatase [Gammaproteobacteria bacterium]